MNFKIKLAEIPIQVQSQYDSLKEYCKDYVVEESENRTSDAGTSQMRKDYRQAEEGSKNGLEIVITPDDIERERENGQEEAEQKSTASQYSPEYLETLVLLRKIAEELPDRDTFLMHGAVISWKDNAYMFTAPSGTGKSTHISLWRKYLGEGVQSINGDKPFLSVSDTEVRAYGTPWAGKERWQHNTSAPLKGICILSQAKENSKTNPRRIPELPAPPDSFHHHPRKSRPHLGPPRQTPNPDPGVVSGVRYLQRSHDAKL